MKLKANTKRLLGTLGIVSGFAPSRSPKEILKNIRLTARDGVATFEATDMETSVSAIEPEAAVESEGVVLLDTKAVDFMKESTSDEIEISREDDKAAIQCGVGANARFPMADPAEFPGYEPIELVKYHTVNRAALMMAITRTSYATDTNSNKFALGGVAFQMVGNSVELIATDGRRLSVQSIGGSPQEGHESKDSQTIVPIKGVQLIQRVLAKESGDEVSLSSDGTFLTVQAGQTSIQLQLLSGLYPKWKSFLAGEPTHNLTTNAGPLVTTIRQAAIVTEKEQRGVTVSVSSNKLKVTASGKDVGESSVEMPVTYEGDGVELDVDHSYVSDIAKSMDAETVLNVGMTDSKKPVKVTTEDNFVGLIMPLSTDR